MSDRSVHDETEARLAHALNRVAEQTTAEPDWGRVVADARPAGRQDNRFGPATFAVAAVVMVLAGLGVAFLSTGSEDVVVSTDGVLILPGEEVLSDDPFIVSAAPAPEPTFDTSTLGGEIVVDPVAEVDADVEQVIEWTGNPNQEKNTLVKATVIGRVDGQVWLTAVHDDPDDQMADPLEPGQVLRTWNLMGSGGSLVGEPVLPDSRLFLEPPDAESDEWSVGVTSYSTPGGWVVWGPLPAEVSVVTFADDEDELWTRPRGGAAVIPTTIAGGERFTVQAFGADGELLATITQTAETDRAEQAEPDRPDTEDGEAAPDPGEFEDDAAAAIEDQPILVGGWEIPDTTLGPEHRPVLIPTDDQLLILHTENGGTDMVGEIYDPATGVATALAPSNAIWRANPAVAWTGEKLLIVGGSNGPGIEDQALVHNPTLGTWRALPPPPEDLIPADEFIVGPGAWTGTELLLWQDGLALDPETEQWRAIADYPGPRRAAAVMAWAGDRIIVWGGCDAAVSQCDERGQRILNGGYVYDPAADTWELMAPSPLAAGTDPIAVVAGDEVLFYSGQVDADGTAARVVLYDPATNSWTALPDPPFVFGQGVAGAWTGTHFILWGAAGDAGTLDDGAALNLETGSWFALPAPPAGFARSSVSMAWIGDRLYLTGGQGAGPLTFTPE